MSSSSCKACEKSDPSNTAAQQFLYIKSSSHNTAEILQISTIESFWNSKCCGRSKALQSICSTTTTRSCTAVRVHTASIHMVLHCRLWVYSRFVDAFTMHSILLHAVSCSPVLIKHEHGMYKVYQNSLWTLWSDWCFSFCGEEKAAPSLKSPKGEQRQWSVLVVGIRGVTVMPFLLLHFFMCSLDL